MDDSGRPVGAGPVSAVTVNGDPADSFSQVDAELPFDPVATQPMKLVVDPADNIANGESMEIVVSYAGTPVQITDADTSLEGWIPACYPLAPPQNLRRRVRRERTDRRPGLVPVEQLPDRQGDVRDAVTVPDTHEAVGIGELVSNDSSAGRTTWIWSEDDPTSTYGNVSSQEVVDLALEISGFEGDVPGAAGGVLRPVAQPGRAPDAHRGRLHVEARPAVRG